LNKAYLPINLKICGYEKVEIFEKSPIELTYAKIDHQQEISFKGFFQSNDSNCEIIHYQIFDVKTGAEFS
jgi:hypothetical protein